MTEVRFSLKEQVTHTYRGTNAGQVGCQTAGNGMTGSGDTDCSKVNCQYVEGRIGRTLEDAAQATHKGICSVSSHRVDHHACLLYTSDAADE